MPAQLPTARVVRQGGEPVLPPPVPLRVRLSPVLGPARTAVGALFAVWPLTAVMLVAMALIWAAGYHAGP
jgi:hypothetical protein